MFCSKCGAAVSNDDVFCAKCGNLLRTSATAASMPSGRSTARSSGSHAGKEARAALAKTYPSQAALEARTALLMNQRNKRKSIVWLFVVVALPVGIYVTLANYRGLMSWGIFAFCVVLALTSLIGWMNGVALSHAEYASLPDSTADGRHRCIFCGNPGIYKHGQYRSNTTFHDCSRCNATLYVS